MYLLRQPVSFYGCGTKNHFQDQRFRDRCRLVLKEYSMVQTAEVMGLIPLMDMEMYVLKRQQANYQALMEQVVGMFERLSDEEPLVACAWALQQVLATAQESLKDIAQRALDGCIQRCITSFDKSAASLSTCQDTDLKVCFYHTSLPASTLNIVTSQTECHNYK